MLYRPDERLFFAADQVIARISPNVSVHAMEPDLDALGIYLRSLSGLRDAVAQDVLVLPGHGLPFYGLHNASPNCSSTTRSAAARSPMHAEQQPLSVAELVPHVFHRILDEHQTGFAFGEVLAHVNHMLGQGQPRAGDRRGWDRSLFGGGGLVTVSLEGADAERTFARSRDRFGLRDGRCVRRHFLEECRGRHEEEIAGHRAAEVEQPVVIAGRTADEHVLEHLLDGAR